jgi:tetratricopeptide (TPR) repeat protein
MIGKIWRKIEKSRGFAKSYAFGLTILLIFNFACSRSSSKETRKEVEEISSRLNLEATGIEDRQILAAQKYIEKIPDSAEGYNRLAIAYIQKARTTGDFSLNAKAEIAVNRALEIEPGNLTAKKLQAALHLIYHRFSEAIELAKKIISTEAPNDSFLYGVLTDANIELGNYKEALEAGQKMVDLRPSMESYIRVSMLRSLYGQVEGAIEAMKMAAQIADPNNREVRAWCLVRLGDEYFRIGDFKEAEKQYDAALEILPNYYLALSAKGKVRAAQGDLDTAIKFYTEAQNRVPLVETVIALGDLYFLQGDKEKANAQYALAEVIEQKFGSLDLRRLALLWADHDIRLDEALNIATKEYERRKDIYTADVYAWTLYKKGNFNEAKKAITEAMRLKTKDARIFYHAGMIEKALGNRQGAIRYIERAIQINPAFDLIQAEKARKVLEELKIGVKVKEKP